MDTLFYILLIYLWVNVAFTLVYRLIESGYEIPEHMKVSISILIPFIGLYLLLKYTYGKNKGDVIDMVNNSKTNIRKTISTLISKSAIQWINFLDYLRGSAR